jgi:hypothetical protein
MSDLLQELAETLRTGTGQRIEHYKFRQGPLQHGAQRVRVGFHIEEVITEYNILRDVIVEAYGGRVNLQSEPGEGARFHFTIPNAKERATYGVVLMSLATITI